MEVDGAMKTESLKTSTGDEDIFHHLFSNVKLKLGKLLSLYLHFVSLHSRIEKTSFIKQKMFTV